MSTDKQKALQRERTKRYRALHKESVTPKALHVTNPPTEIPEKVPITPIAEIPITMNPLSFGGAVPKVESDRPNSDKVEPEQKSDKYVSITNKQSDELIEIAQSLPGCTGLTANQLYAAIRSYPQDTWKDSPEFKELMRRLHKMSIDQLESGGYRIPAWRYERVA